LRAQAT
jgi:hypothetical protein